MKPFQLEYPASQRDMDPQSDSDLSKYTSANKLKEKVALISGGDSGIGQSVAIALSESQHYRYPFAFKLF